MLREERNKKLKRLISALDDEGKRWSLFTYNKSNTAEYDLIGTDVPRKEAFDWLHGKDRETAEVTKQEKLRIIREKLLADVEVVMQTCEEHDSWLNHLWHDRDRTLTLTPRQR